MRSLLGRITHIEPRESRGPETALSVRFKPACVMPKRSAVPEWLRDQSLSVERSVVDPREVGRPGDSVLLSPAESAPWLEPLVVTPAVAYGALPATLQIALRWWKEPAKLPEFTVRANAREQVGRFTPGGAGGVATIETAGFFDAPPRLPVTFEIVCDTLKCRATVLPSGEPCAARVTTPDGEAHRLENLWYAVDVSARSHGGAIQALRERGRGVDHFRRPEDEIQEELFHAGFYERILIDDGWDWSGKLTDAAMTCAGTRREPEALRLTLEGVVDDGMNLRTAAGYTLLDRLPLLRIEREYCFQKGKEKEDRKEKESGPKEPVDRMRSVAFGIRSATLVERNGSAGTRTLTLDGDRLEVIRSPEVSDSIACWDWRIRCGWILCEHPARRHALLYLFDPAARLELHTWWGPRGMTVEPRWPHLPVRHEEGAGYALALAAGEVCGAGPEGAWVACRAPLPGGGIRCAVVARLRATGPSTAAIALDGDRREVPLERLLLPAVGAIAHATADFPSGRMDAALDVSVAGIAGRE